MPLPFTIPPGEPDGFVADGQQLHVGGLSCQVIFTPGHSPGHVCYHFPDERLLVGGDLIIGGAVGRTDLPDSDPAALDASIARVMSLPGETQLLPGHGAPSRLEDEARSNPYVRAALAGRL
jgi:glyoxylase-like metal-dependent hydrolase (beta-lactamase superfamily II)